MDQVLIIIALTSVSGACIPLGGSLASIEHIQPNWLEEELRHFIIALGGGILLGAVSEVLIPEGIAHMNQSVWALGLTILGGLTFFALERQLGLRRREMPQMTGMLLDYIPEAIALGGLVALQSPSTMLLALLICMQNLPEGFNAYRELIVHNGNSPQRTLQFMGLLVFVGPLAGLSGYFFFATSPQMLGAMMLFASGGILYLIFQDIAPQSRLERHWFPPLGAVMGFCLALFGEMLML